MQEKALIGTRAWFQPWRALSLWLLISFFTVSAFGATYYWNRNGALTNDKDFSRSYNWTVNADGTGAYAPSLKDDDFTSDALGSAWSFIDRDNDGGTGANSLASDQLTLTGRGSDVYTTNNQYVGIFRNDILNNFVVTVKVVSMTNTDGWAKAGIMVANDINNVGDGGYAQICVTPTNGVQFIYDISGTIGEVETNSTTGGLSAPIWLAMVKSGGYVSAYYKTAIGNAWTQVGTAQSSQSSRMYSSVGLYTTSHNTGSTITAVFDDFTGGGTLSAGADLSLNGTGGNADASATLGSADISANSLDMTGYAGTLNFGGQNGLFATYYSATDFTGTSIARVDTTVLFAWGAAAPDAAIPVDNWSAVWEGFIVPDFTDTYTFYSDHDDGLRLWVNDTKIMDQWAACCTEHTSSTLNLVAGQRYPIRVNLKETGGDGDIYLKWSSNTYQAKVIIPKRSLFAGKLTITGTGTCLNMAAGTVTAADGLIDFSAPSGTQTFVPRSAQTVPKILHSGAGILQFATNNLTTIGFANSAGGIDFNGRNVTTVAGGTNRGDFAIWNGTSSTINNLAARTITVAGHASFRGQAGNLLNINRSSNWTLAVTGQLTAEYADVGKSQATVSAGTAYKSTDGGSNAGWTINTGTFYWDRNAVISSSTDFSKAYNWASGSDGWGFRPTSASDDRFDSETLGSAWTFKDADNEDDGGSYRLSGGVLTVASQGDDIYGGANEYSGVYRTDITGNDFDVQVTVLSQSSTDAWAKSGILIGNNLSTPSSGGNAMVMVTPGHNFAFLTDVNAPVGEMETSEESGASTLTFPCQIRLIRSGTNLSAWYRTVGGYWWTQIGSTRSPSGLANGTNSQIGLVVCPKSTSTTGNVVFDNFQAGTNISTTDDAFSFNGTAANSDANATLSGSFSAKSIDFTGYTGTFNFGSYTLSINTGNATFVAGQGITAGTGTLSFTGTSGTQVFIPKSGATFPLITKTAGSTLQLSTNALTTLGYTQSAGTLDFNGVNLSTTSSGNFTLTAGTGSSFENVGGRTITVAGNTSITGTPGNLAELSGNAWTLAATGTLTASYASITNSTASVTTGIATNSVNGGGNNNWNFGTHSFSAWSYNTRIGFNTASTGANISGSVTNFPLLVRLTANNFDFTQALSTGADIRFTDPDGSLLAHEIESWDATNKKANIWVRIPQVDGNSDRDYITLYWGNNSASTISNGTAVFDTTLGYEAVWHMNTGMTDATANALSLTDNNGSVQDTGNINEGRRMDGTNSNLTRGNATPLNMTAAITLSAWIKPLDWTGGNRRLIQKSTGDNQWRLYRNSSGLEFHLYGLSTGATLQYATLPSLGQWHLVTGTYNGSTSKLYIDGNLVASQAASGSIGTTTDGLDVGCKFGGSGTDHFFGTMDETVVASTALSADYIKLAYETQKPTSSFLIFPNSNLSTWSYSTKVYVNTTATGANITTDQTNYPLLVRLSNNNFNFSQALSSGADLRFADSLGNLLSYEIERYDATTKAADIWVLLPTVKGNNNSQWFKMYWGKSGVASLSSGPAVFLGSAGYVGVWHLSEDGNTTASGYKDATGFKNAGTGIALASTDDVASVVGIGSNFTNASNQGITVPNIQAFNSTNLTLESWINSGTPSAYKRIVGKPFSSNSAPWNQYDLELDVNGTKGVFSVNLGGVEAGYTTTTTFSTSTWYHLVGTYDGVTQRVYCNGILETAAARAGTITDYSMPVAIGKYYHGTGSNWDGKLDEVRISNVTRSADWLKLSYENMKIGATMVMVGNRTREYAKSLQLGFNTQAGGADVAGNVANIPILVRLTTNNFDFTAVRNDGADIQFVDKDGTYLYHEVVEWDKANSLGKVWVKVPQVDGNSISDFITLYYGCSTCTGSPYAVKDSVWNGYNAVYHLSGGETKGLDATAYANHSTYSHDMPNASGLTTPLTPLFDGTSNFITVADNAQLDGENTTWSFWIKTTDVGDNATWYDSKYILDRDAVGTADDWALVLNNANAKLRYSTRNAVLNGNVDVGDGNWHMVSIVKTTTNAYIYVDGAQDVTAANTDVLSNSQTLYIMNENGTADWTRGQLNELALYPSNRSADFIKLSYQNQKSTDALISYPVSTTSFTSNKIFKFNTTSTGANVSGDVYDFPMLLRFTDATLIDATQSGGQDIRFLDADGVTWLDYQIERWDQGANLGEIWVKVPKVDGNSSADFITMYYNDISNGTVPDGQCATCVFSTGNGFIATYHMSETSGTSTSDATANGRTGTKVSATEPNPVAGLIGKGQDFDGANDWDNLGTNLNWANNATAVTLDAWIYKDVAALNKGILAFSKANGSATNQSRGQIEILGDGKAKVSGRSADADAGATLSSTNAISSATWTHIVGILNYQGDSLTVCVNGTCNSSGSVGFGAKMAASGNSYSAALGAEDDGASNWFDGIIDEARISNVARNLNWVKLSYESQRATPTLFNPSPADFSGTQKYTFNTTKTGANVMDSVTNFPLLVRITGSTIFNATDANNNGIRFLDGDGKTWLNYAVERWNTSVDSGEVWVMVPKVDGNSDHDFITLYYGNSTAGNGQCEACVYPTTSGWVGAWHLNTSGTGTRPNSVTGGNVATPANYDNDEFTGGVIAGADNLDGGAPGDYLNLGTGYSDFSTGLTLSLWAYPTSSASWSRLFDLGSGQAVDNLILSRNGTGTTLSFEPYNNTTSGGYTSIASAIANNVWQQFTVTMDASNNVKLYKNGVLVQSGTSSQTPRVISRTSNFIGRSNWGADAYYQGRVDQPEISNVARSADWIKLSYETQTNGTNLFWNTRPGPNNLATLTATAGSNSISLAWTAQESDSANADSVGLWVKYTAPPDSVGATGQSRVVVLPKSDSAYTYPATYPGTYYFALAVRNTAGKWSPFTASSTDTLTLGGSVFFTDTVYVDSAIGNDSNTCTQARSPFTPKLTLVSAMGCETNSINDSLVIRVLPGTYTDNDLDPNVKPQIITSFDQNSRAVLSGTGSMNDGGTKYATVFIRNDLTLKNLDIQCATNNNFGVHFVGSDDNSRVEGCRIYNNGALKHDRGINISNSGSNYVHVGNNLIYEPTTYGVYAPDNSFNIVYNVLIGTGAANTKGIYAPIANGWTDMTIANNILSNWDYGIQTANANIGVCSNNLFHMVTTNRELLMNSVAQTNIIVKDPLFANTTVGNANAFKLLPSSPAIDAGTTSYAGGGESVPARSPTDQFGINRPIGTAPDIGIYEGTGYAPNLTGEFDPLTATSDASTVTVYNSKWKIIFDAAKGSGINWFSNQAEPGTNLLASGAVLLDAKIGSYTASAQTNPFAPSLLEKNTSRVVVRQWLPVSTSLNVRLTYSIYSSGHIFVHSEIENITLSSLALTSIDYTLKLGTTTTSALVYGRPKSGFGFLTTGTRDVLLAVSADSLDAGASASETWALAAAAGPPGTIIFNTANPANSPVYNRRSQHFLLYVGETNLDYAKASTMVADINAPSVITTSAGGLQFDRSWQDAQNGHWNFDDGGGTIARDKAVYYQNNATLTSLSNPVDYKWVSGKVGGGLYLTQTDVAEVPDIAALEASVWDSYMFWVKPDFSGMGNTAFIISKGLTTGNGWYFRKVAGQNQITFNMGTGSATTPTLPTNVWSHITAVVNPFPQFIELYVNGILVANSPSGVPAVATANSSTLRFGENAGAGAVDRFQGTLDDIRIIKKPLKLWEIQAMYNRGFAARNGSYSLRADNNNRLVALINGNAAQTRVQPAFQIINWNATATPKYVYVNGTRLKPTVDYVAAIERTDANPSLIIQLNKTLKDADQSLFIDDDDSTGYMGEAARMKTLTMSATANDKFIIKNFSDTVFGAATSGQWYTELDLNGWTNPNQSRIVDTGFGGFNIWKAAAVSPNLSISAATQLVGQHSEAGRSLMSGKIQNNTNPNAIFFSGRGYAGPANIGYTLVDSSSARISLTLESMTFSSSDGTATVTKRYTVYPTGRIVASFQIATSNFNMDMPRLDLNLRYNSGQTQTWSAATAASSARYGYIDGDLDYHSTVMGLLSIKSAGTTVTAPASTVSSADVFSANSGGADLKNVRLYMPTTLFESTDDPITVNWALDISKDFRDSATADSLMRDIQSPAAITAIVGTANPSDALDFHATGDGFAEGDGAYVYTSSAGVAHFKFVDNTVTHFSPAFRIKGWTFGILPEYVIVDNQVLTLGYQYNAYLNNAANEIIMQFNKTFTPGTHLFYISHKTGLAVKLNKFEAKSGEGVDTLQWSTESEFENLGFHLYRRIASADAQIDTSLAGGKKVAGAGIANALMEAARAKIAAKVAANLAKAEAKMAGAEVDTLPSMFLTSEELALLGYERLTTKMIPGAKGGASATTQNYQMIDRTAAFGVAYEYLLEAIDFNGNREQYGPRLARPTNPLFTELYPNYPNPFNPITTLHFSLKEKAKVSLIIYDGKGKVVRTMLRPEKPMLPGKYRLIWDAKNNSGMDVPSGQYFYRFTAPHYNKTRKMILVK